MVKKGDIIFVKGGLLSAFLGLVHPFITEPYILLSCNDDAPSGYDNQISYINEEKIVLLGCINCLAYNHPKIVPIPIGIPPGSSIGFPKKDEYTSLVLKKNIKKDFCISNFDTSSHPRRQYVHDTVIKKPFIKKISKTNPNVYLYNLASSSFCISPRGAGMDCFRTWESLILNCIPIVETSFLDPLFYRLPVLIINDYEDLQEDQLFNFYQYTKENPEAFDLDKIYAKYWIDFFLQLQILIQNNENPVQFIRDFKKTSFNL